MKKYLSRIVLSLPLVIAALLGQDTTAATREGTQMTEAEAKMFSVSAGYERFRAGGVASWRPRTSSLPA